MPLGREGLIIRPLSQVESLLGDINGWLREGRLNKRGAAVSMHPLQRLIPAVFKGLQVRSLPSFDPAIAGRLALPRTGSAARRGPSRCSLCM